MISGINKKDSELTTPGASGTLKKYASLIAEKQQEKNSQYEDALKAQKTSRDLTDLVPVLRQSQAVERIEKPLPANAVALYDPDIFDLEMAAHDCRLEMIKIVREVRQPIHHSVALDAHDFISRRSYRRS